MRKELEECQAHGEELQDKLDENEEQAEEAQAVAWAQMEGEYANEECQICGAQLLEGYAENQRHYKAHLDELNECRRRKGLELFVREEDDDLNRGDSDAEEDGSLASLPDNGASRQASASREDPLAGSPTSSGAGDRPTDDDDGRDEAQQSSSPQQPPRRPGRPRKGMNKGKRKRRAAALDTDDARAESDVEPPPRVRRRTVVAVLIPPHPDPDPFEGRRVTRAMKPKFNGEE